MAIYPRPPVPANTSYASDFANQFSDANISGPVASPAQTGQAALASSQQAAPEAKPDLLQQFLGQLQSLLGQPEEMLQQPGPPNFNEQFNLAAAAPYNPAATFDYNLKREQQGRDIANENVRMRNQGRQRKIDDLQRAANMAALVPGREAGADLARARTEALLNPMAGDDKVWLKIRRYDPATGRTYVKDLPRAEARRMYDAGIQIEVITPENLAGAMPNRFLATTDGWQEVSPAGGTGPTGMYPPAPQGFVTALQQQMSLTTQLREGMRAFNALVPQMSGGKRVALDWGRQLPGGRLIAGWLTPQGELTAKALDIAGDTVLRIASGAQISEPEAQRIRAFLPKVGDNPLTAAGAFAQTYDRLATALEVQMSIRPDLVPPSLVFEVKQMAEEARRASQPIYKGLPVQEEP